MTQEFVTLPREVVELAIETLLCTDSEEGSTAFEDELKAVKKLRAALDKPQANQPAMTPIAQRKLDSLLTEGYTISGYSIYNEQKHQHGFVTGAGLVGWWKPEGMEHPQPRCEQPLRYLDGGSRYKVTHLKTSGYCIIGLPEELLGRWVALVDATDNKHMDSHQQPPTTEQSSAVQQPRGEQEPVAWLTIEVMGPRTRVDVEWEDQLKKLPSGIYKLYTNPQPKLEPLTDAEIGQALRWFYQDHRAAEIGLEDDIAVARAIEAAHNIK